jgi:hypothetical protein
MTKLQRDEFGEQQAFVGYLQLMQNKRKIVKYTAIPNNTWTPSQAQKTKNTEQGLRAGFPDLLIVLWYCVICIEMKVRPNKPTLDQSAWIDALNGAGIETIVCYSYEEAKAFLDRKIAS